MVEHDVLEAAVEVVEVVLHEVLAFRARLRVALVIRC